jgi:heme oxygenase
MSLRDLTAEKHQQAEQTQFMQRVFAKTLPNAVWTDFILQKWSFYNIIEKRAQQFKLLDDLPYIDRADLLYVDYMDMCHGLPTHTIKLETQEYCEYLRSLQTSDQILSHVYTWHMGDMYGGQLIAEIIQAPHRHLIFENREQLIETFRAKLHDGMADEANCAFDWAIKIMNSYEL